MLMVVFTYVVLAWFGLALGSFVNALVWRERRREQKPGSASIWKGRSACPDCGHQLAPRDLVPVLSWLYLRGRCRYCGKPISPQYPVVELAVTLVFVLSYAFWPQQVVGWQWVLFVTWLAASVGLMALLVYDLRWWLLPARILYPTAVIAFAGRLVYLLGGQTDKARALLLWALSVLVAAGIFWILHRISDRLIGYGDVQLGLVTGTLLADPALSFLMIFMASVMGTLFMLPSLAAGSKNLTSRLPYGPFLIAATGICVLFGQNILDWYQRVFLP